MEPKTSSQLYRLADDAEAILARWLDGFLSADEGFVSADFTPGDDTYEVTLALEDGSHETFTASTLERDCGVRFEDDQREAFKGMVAAVSSLRLAAVSTDRYKRANGE